MNNNIDFRLILLGLALTAFSGCGFYNMAKGTSEEELRQAVGEARKAAKESRETK